MMSCGFDFNASRSSPKGLHQGGSHLEEKVPCCCEGAGGSSEVGGVGRVGVESSGISCAADLRPGRRACWCLGFPAAPPRMRAALGPPEQLQPLLLRPHFPGAF